MNGATVLRGYNPAPIAMKTPNLRTRNRVSFSRLLTLFAFAALLVPAFAGAQVKAVARPGAKPARRIHGTAEKIILI